MSDLKPRGVPVTVCGEERRLLFTINAVEEIQETLDMPILEALDIMANDMERQYTFIKKILTVLLDSEADLVKLQTGKDLRRFTEKEVGLLVGTDNKLDIVLVILQAFNNSMPESSGDDDPNQTGGHMKK